MKTKSGKSFFSIVAFLAIFGKRDKGQAIKTPCVSPDVKVADYANWSVYRRAQRKGEVMAGVPTLVRIDADECVYGPRGTRPSGSYLCRSFKDVSKHLVGGLGERCYESMLADEPVHADTEYDRRLVKEMNGVVSLDPVPMPGIVDLFARTDVEVFYVKAGTPASDYGFDKSYNIIVAQVGWTYMGFADVKSFAEYVRVTPATVRKWIGGKSKPNAKLEVAHVQSVTIDA